MARDTNYLLIGSEFTLASSALLWLAPTGLSFLAALSVGAVISLISLGAGWLMSQSGSVTTTHSGPASVPSTPIYSGSRRRPTRDYSPVPLPPEPIYGEDMQGSYVPPSRTRKVASRFEAAPTTYGVPAPSTYTAAPRGGYGASSQPAAIISSSQPASTVKQTGSKFIPANQTPSVVASSKPQSTVVETSSRFIPASASTALQTHSPSTIISSSKPAAKVEQTASRFVPASQTPSVVATSKPPSTVVETSSRFIPASAATYTPAQAAGIGSQPQCVKTTFIPADPSKPASVTVHKPN